ncbi:MAG: hypothetical protein QOH60_5243 [Mycobacterium sp.]|jgi:predicted  nucleic acid-binding Zn-ribbon protein|nr:hypothetical protein [Mycobacterium sp.]
MRWRCDDRQYARHVEPGNLESRVTALEHQVRDLAGRVQASEQDAAAARVLAGAADRDVGALSGELRDFRADTAANFAALRSSTTASFNALRDDFVDLRVHMDQEFAKVDQEFAKINQEFVKLDRGFMEVRGKLDATAAGQQQIVDLLQSFTGNQGSEGDE